MSSPVHDWFAAQMALAHSKGGIPHGPSLPESMPWKGDVFFLENDDGSDTMCVWWGDGHWERGPKLKRPKHDH